MPTDHFALCGHTLDEKYRVDALVAEGGFGFVYRAVHVHLKKTVALKVLKLNEYGSPEARNEIIATFQSEAETVAKLDHPAIVKVLDYGVSTMPANGIAPWMVLEWVEGVTLADDLSDRRDTLGRTPREVLAMLRPVLSGLAKAHAAGVAHRDIKPRNLMLVTRRSDAPWEADEPPVKILDFGIAKEMGVDEAAVASGQTTTRSTHVSFSLRYATPEQVSGTRTGPWTDVHQIAMVIVEMLINRSPYRHGDMMDVHMQALSPLRPTPARFGLDVGSWEPVLAKALSVKPSDRYGNAGELLTELMANVPDVVKPIAAADGAAPPPSSIALDATQLKPPLADRSESTFRPAVTATATVPRRASRQAIAAVSVCALIAVAVFARSFMNSARAPSTHALVVAPPVTQPPVVQPPVIAPPAIAPTPAAPVIAAPVAVNAADAGVAPSAAQRPRSRREGRRPAVLIAPIRVN